MMQRLRGLDGVVSVVLTLVESLPEGRANGRTRLWAGLIRWP